MVLFFNRILLTSKADPQSFKQKMTSTFTLTTSASNNSNFYWLSFTFSMSIRTLFITLLCANVSTRNSGRLRRREIRKINWSRWMYQSPVRWVLYTRYPNNISRYDSVSNKKIQTISMMCLVYLLMKRKAKLLKICCFVNLDFDVFL